ncbi:PAS domain S-box protein [Dehalogenimonas sp. THU2]|uniref:PAS domain S-box protein n=1 Tax=Dehalogenimonas sp. THU2 TaxID=3151121 RepID=UPI003218A941
MVIDLQENQTPSPNKSMTYKPTDKFPVNPRMKNCGPNRTPKLKLVLRNHILALINKATDVKSLLNNLVLEIKDITGCSVSAIRLVDERGSIPYRAYSGFANGFFEFENALSIISDKCMCINVITGTTDPKLPYYTPSGSFYINATTAFLSSVADDEKGVTRNACSAFGYESVALIPIKSGTKIIGLIHIADHNENMVPLSVVNQLETLTYDVGIAIERLVEYERIQNSEQYYRSLIDKVPAGYLVLDAEGCVLEANLNLLEMIGYLREDVLGKDFIDFVAIERRALFREGFNRLNGQGESSFECVLIASDGFHKEVSIAGHSDATNDSGSWKVYCVVNDITQRKRAEQEIRNLATLPLINPNPIIQVTPEGVIVFANIAARPLLECWHTRYGKTLPPSWQQAVREVFRTGTMKTDELQHLGHVYDLKLFPVPELGFVNIYGIDITKRYRQSKQQ